MTQSSRENYFYHKCKNDNLEKLSPKIYQPPFLKRPTPIPYFHPQFIGSQGAHKIHFPPSKKEGLTYGFISWEAPPPSLHLTNCPEVYTDK